MYKKYLRWELKNPFIALLPIFTFVVLDNLYTVSIAKSFSLFVAFFLFSYNYIFTKKGELNWYVIPFFVITVIVTLFLDMLDFDEFRPIAGELITISLFLLLILFKKLIIKLFLSNRRKFFVGIQENLEFFFRVLGLSAFIFTIHVVNFFVVSCLDDEESLYFYEKVELFFLLFLGVYVSVKMFWLKYYFEKEELWPILNDAESVVEYELKSSVYQQNKEFINPMQKNIHPIVRILLIADNKILLKKNDLNDFYYPGKWDLAISGHLLYGETYRDCMNRLLLKNYNIREEQAQYLLKYTYENKNEVQRVFLHYMFVNNSFLENLNLSNVKFWTSDQIINELESHIFTDKLEKEIILLKQLSFPYLFK